ncbi:MAG: adenylosuccinate lyase family protein [Salinirussus sp.]
MPSFHTNGVLFKNVFGTPEMREIFSEERFIERFLEVEAALARVQADLGIIPAWAAEEITERATLDHLDMDRVEENVAEVHLFSMSIIDAWKDELGDAGEYVHWGATTQDIGDTALILQVREGLDVVERDVAAVADALETLTERHAETPMMGRTHMVHAIPITFGLKTASWLDEVNRHRDRLAAIRDRVEVLEFFGATGTLASLGEEGLAVQEGLAEELDLGVPDVAWFAARDRIADAVATLGLVTSTMARIAKQVLFMNREEVGEASEPHDEGAIGSSTMPHKRNPVKSEETVLLGRLTRAHVGSAMELMETADERDFSATLGEFAVVPETFLYVSRALAYVHDVTADLVVHEEGLERNLHHHGPVVASEAVMMGLADELGRQTAHDLTHEAAGRALDGEASFVDALLENDSIAAAFSREELESMADPASYVGQSARLARRALEHSRARE